MQNRSKKAMHNIVAGLTYQLVAVICGFILPRLILSAFGSSYNGVTASITQFLNIISVLKAGIGSVTTAALYRPLAENNIYEISAIIKATEKFMRRIALIFSIFIVIFACIYPIFVQTDFDWLFTFSLVLILGIGTFVQYYFGITYQLLLSADQRQSIISIIQIISIILNTIIAAILIKVGAGIHLVKLGSAIAFAINPIVIRLYSKQKYHMIKNIKPDNSGLKQRWDAFAIEMASFVNNNTDIMILTVFSGVKLVSVYSVYYLVINGILQLVGNSVNGIDSAFGNMLAKKEYNIIEKNFRMYELLVFSLTNILLIVTAFTINPFVQIYTEGINDIDYNRPLFSVIITLTAYFTCIRVPYVSIVRAAGHFQQTKKGSMIEAFLNITLSIILAGPLKLGLVGVAIGSLCATIFRTLQYASYMSSHIIIRSMKLFIKHLLGSLLTLILVYNLVRILPLYSYDSYSHWAVNASMIGFIALMSTLTLNIVFFRNDFSEFMKKVINVLHVTE